MSLRSRLAASLPYLVLLAAAIWFYVLAGRISYSAAEGRLGPDAWPRAVLALLIAVCAYESLKRLVFGGGSVAGMLEAFLERSGEAGAGARVGIARLGGGIAATVAYVALVALLGFFLATAAFLAAFVRIGGYRRWGVALACGVVGSLALVVLFMKLVYVSLPLGAGPFRALSVALIGLLGIR